MRMKIGCHQSGTTVLAASILATLANWAAAQTSVLPGVPVVHVRAVSGAAQTSESESPAVREKERRILVSARHGRLRVSPHFYNDETDLETLRKALA